MIHPYSINNKTASYSQRISYFEYLYVFVLIIYAGRANTYVASDSLMENPVGVFLLIILSGILARRWEIRFNKQFYLLIFFFFIYFIAISIKYKEIRPTIFLTYFFKFFIVYTTVRALKFDLFKIYEYVLYYLAIIGLLMWGIQFILGGDSLYYYFNNIPGINSFSYEPEHALNVIIYSVMPTSASLLYNFMVPRNCGYAWEPGAFAVYLCLAIFVNLFITNSDRKGKFRFWVLLLALITTQSTTGYAIFSIIILFYYLNKIWYIKFLALPIIIAALIYMFTLPFMYNKIVGLYNEKNEIDYMVMQTIGIEEGPAAQRFSSFFIAIRDFYDNPILGLGSHEETWYRKIGANISPISGIGNLLAQWGIIGFLFFIISSIKSSFFFSKYYNYKGKFLLFLIILFISISYSILFLPLIMCFWMFSIFEPQNSIHEEANNLVLNAESNVVDP